jgi:hypothetical protein
MTSKHDLRMLRESKRKSDVLRSLSELSILWRTSDTEHSETTNQPGIQNNPMPDSASGLDGARTQRSGNPATGQVGSDTVRTRGDNQGKEK